MLQIAKLEELWNDVYESLKIYKDKTKAFHGRHSLEKISGRLESLGF